MLERLAQEGVVLDDRRVGGASSAGHARSVYGHCAGDASASRRGAGRSPSSGQYRFRAIETERKRQGKSGWSGFRETTDAWQDGYVAGRKGALMRYFAG